MIRHSVTSDLSEQMFIRFAFGIFLVVFIIISQHNIEMGLTGIGLTFI